jgi:FixJ family two-component response regulator
VTNKQTASVHIVDDDTSLRTALSRLLTASGYHTVSYESATDFLQNGALSEPGCLLLDIDMPGLSGMQLQEHLAKASSNLPIVFLTGQGSIATSVRAIKGGAEDFLSKPVEKEALLDAIERAMVRYQETSLRQEKDQQIRSRFNLLTAREREVFKLLLSGMLNKQIAYQLGNTERTVKLHRHCIMEKMQAKTLAELIVAAANLGMLNQQS